MRKMIDIYKFLADNNIEYERHDHPPVFTCEDVNRLVPPLPGAKTKNLFLRDYKGRQHFLVIVGYEKVVDLKALSSILGVSKLSFGSAERLQRYLEVDPGAVSVLAIVNDLNKVVEVIIDTTLWQCESFQFHPLVNTSTLVLSRDNIKRFLDITEHRFRILDVPSQNKN